MSQARTRSLPSILLGAALLSGLAPACASYRYLPLAPPDDARAPSPLGYESTRLFFFHGRGDDSLIERVFVSPGGATLLATALRPAPGVLASRDGGASWTFSELPLDPRVSPRVLREVLFDPRDQDRIYARTFLGLLLSRDGGASWQRVPLGEHRARALDALALGADGTIYAAQGDALYASEDRGESFQPLPLVIPFVGTPTNSPARPGAPAEDVKPDPVRIRSVLPDPAHPKTIYVSVEPEPPAENFQRRLIGLLDQTTEEGKEARALLQLPDEKPLGPIAFGDKRAGVYVTKDGGRLWQKTALGLDAWLIAHDGAIYAIAAEPLIVAAGLARKTPALATAIDAQLHENGFDFDSLRRACAYPGQGEMLAAAPTAPLFRSGDEGESWSRVAAPGPALALALRLDVDRARLGRDPWPPRPAVRAPETHDEPVSTVGPDRPSGPRGRRRPAPEPLPPPPPDLTAPLLSLLEPAGLLSHLGPDLPLTGVAGNDGVLWAYAPTEAYWNLLTETLVRATKRQGELSLGNGSVAPEDGAGFQLLRSDDAGRTWESFPMTLDRYGILAARGVAPYPDAVASTRALGLFILAGHDQKGQPWRQLLRESVSGTQEKAVEEKAR